MNLLDRAAADEGQASSFERLRNGLGPTSSRLQIRRVQGGELLRAADGLLREFTNELAGKYEDCPDLARQILGDLSWGSNGRVDPDYRPPHGTLLLASDDDGAVGMVGVRTFAGLPACAELKRLYVRPEQRGKGYSRALLASAIDWTRCVCYERLLLESGERLGQAMHLYRDAGFEPVAAYRVRPAHVERHFASMAISLDPLAHTAADLRFRGNTH